MVFAGGGDVFGADAGQAGGTLAIIGFGASDLLHLGGYGSGAVAAVLAGASVAGGNTVLTLPDNTQVLLFGVTNLTAASFV